MQFAWYLQGTKGPEDQGTRGPGDQRTRGPKDQGNLKLFFQYFFSRVLDFFPGNLDFFPGNLDVFPGNLDLFFQYHPAKCINLSAATVHGSPKQAEESRGPSATLFRAPGKSWGNQ